MRGINYLFWGIFGLWLVSISTWFLIAIPFIILAFGICDYYLEKRIN